MAKRPPPPPGMEEFERTVLEPFRDGKHPLGVDFVQARNSHNPRRGGEKQDHVFVYKDKEGGIEPGCLVFDVSDEKIRDTFYKKMQQILIKKIYDTNIALTIAKKEKNRTPFEKALLNLKKHNPSLTMDELINKIFHSLNKDVPPPQNNFMFKRFFGSGTFPDCEKELMESYVDWRKNLPLDKQPPMTFLKGDFPNGDKKGKVSVGAERTMVTSKMKAFAKIFGKTITKNSFGKIYNRFFKRALRKEKNLDFTQETIINNLAVGYGMQGEIASIKPGMYKDGYPMLMNSQIWAKGFSTFEGRLEGGTKSNGSCIAREFNSNRDKEMVELLKESPQLEKVKFRSDETIGGIPQGMAFFLHAGDYDMLGSTGGNKGVVNGKLYAIDFGKSFASKNDILVDSTGEPNLRDDFRFKQPSSTLKHIKHIDALYDHPLAEMMQGVYFMMKQNGIKVPENVLQWYRNKADLTPETPESKAAKAFLETYDKIEFDSAPKLFQGYIDQFKEAAKRNPMYEGYSEEVEKLQERYKKRMNDFLAVFQKRMLLTPDELNLLENVEKLLCDPKHITNTSKDGTVLLNHLRVDFDHRIPCQMKKIGDDIELRIDIRDPKKAAVLEGRFKDFIKKDGTLSNELEFDSENPKEIIIFCPKHKIADLMRAFQENNVANYHKKPTATFLQEKVVQIHAQRLTEAKRLAETEEQNFNEQFAQNAKILKGLHSKTVTSSSPSETNNVTTSPESSKPKVHSRAEAEARRLNEKLARNTEILARTRPRAVAPPEPPKVTKPTVLPTPPKQEAPPVPKKPVRPAAKEPTPPPVTKVVPQQPPPLPQRPKAADVKAALRAHQAPKSKAPEVVEPVQPSNQQTAAAAVKAPVKGISSTKANHPPIPIVEPQASATRVTAPEKSVSVASLRAQFQNAAREPALDIKEREERQRKIAEEIRNQRKSSGVGILKTTQFSAALEKSLNQSMSGRPQLSGQPEIPQPSSQNETTPKHPKPPTSHSTRKKSV